MEKVKEFRTHSIIRTCKRTYKNYSSYKKYLKKDFKNRCAYCNLLDENITTYFEVDHFIPEAVFTKINRDDLLTDYNNLIYSCKKCNQAKKHQYEGDNIGIDLKNTKFYDPVETPLQNIFYRNILGGIDSIDIKGRKMIIDLKLYRLSHNFEWIVEVLQAICTKLEMKISNIESSGGNSADLRYAHSLISEEFHKVHKVFLANYNKD
ncbi:MAG: HNH endonuclease [Lactococcus lactis]